MLEKDKGVTRLPRCSLEIFKELKGRYPKPEEMYRIQKCLLSKRGTNTISLFRYTGALAPKAQIVAFDAYADYVREVEGEVGLIAHIDRKWLLLYVSALLEEGQKEAMKCFEQEL